MSKSKEIAKQFGAQGFEDAINEVLEWAAQQADNLECGDPTPRCTIAERIRAGKSGRPA